MSYVHILLGDVMGRLQELPTHSVHCVITSPPYWGLREYGVKGQLGQEPTYDEHIKNLIAVFREIRRVLRPDGTVWLNYGDAYGSGVNGRSAAETARLDTENRLPTFRDKPYSTLVGSIKPKDLCLIPHRLAIALQDDGWWVRSDIIWAKPNPMPESVTDRPVSSHEHIFLLTQEENYFYDIDAVREPHTSIPKGKENDPDAWMLGEQHDRKGRPGRKDVIANRPPGYYGHELGRNKRDVWYIAVEPFHDAHFATFPRKLVEPCIKAGTSAHGVCAKCGAQWKRIIEATGRDGRKAILKGRYSYDADGNTLTTDHRIAKHERGSFNAHGEVLQRRTIGWEPTCKCQNKAIVPALVLDPFGGSGTVGLVANELGRDAILIELNPTSVDIAQNRIIEARGIWVDNVAVFQRAYDLAQRGTHESSTQRLPRKSPNRQASRRAGKPTRKSAVPVVRRKAKSGVRLQRRDRAGSTNRTP